MRILEQIKNGYNQYGLKRIIAGEFFFRMDQDGAINLPDGLQ